MSLSEVASVGLRSTWSGLLPRKVWKWKNLDSLIFQTLNDQVGTCIWDPLSHLSGRLEKKHMCEICVNGFRFSQCFPLVFIINFKIGKYFCWFVDSTLFLQWIPQFSTTIHNDQMCALATFRKGLQDFFVWCLSSFYIMKFRFFPFLEQCRPSWGWPCLT